MYIFSRPSCTRLSRVVGLALVLPLALTKTATAQISGDYNYNGSRQAYFVTGNAAVSGDISINDVQVGKDNAGGFNTIPSGVTLSINAGAIISGSNISEHYPDGKYHYGLNAFGANRVEMSGGSMETASGYDTSVFDITGGSVFNISGNDSSTINISGGNVSYAYGEDNGALNISGGSVYKITGGRHSTTNISGGSVSEIFGNSNSVFHITGGTIGSAPVMLLSNCIITFTGTGLALSSGVAGSDDFGAYTAYTLSGTLQGGQSVNGVKIFDYDGGLPVNDPYSGTGSVRFLTGAAAVPEPGAAAFGMIAAFGVLGLIARRRGTTNAKEA